MFRIAVRLATLSWIVAATMMSGAKLVGHHIHTELLAFMSDRRLNPEIYIQDMRWSLPVRVTRNSEWADTPAWSTDGRLAYAANFSGNWEVYVLNIWTGITTNVTQDSARNDYSPAWSTDGRLVFVSAVPNYFGEINILDLCTGNLRNTHQVGQNPMWSKDGRLAYAANISGNWEIYVYDVERDTAVNVTNDKFNEWSPSWSPDGQQLAYMSNLDGNSDIFVINPATGARVAVTNHEADDLFPKWSADGRLAFMSSRSGNAEIYVLNLLTGITTNVTHNGHYDTSPAWMWSQSDQLFAGGF